MKTLLNNNTDPAYNLALEEYLLKYKSLSDDLFYVWRNAPSIIIGRNQNPFYEVHLKPLFNQQIPLIRRISGGGTVYHDLGNINFSFITHDLSKTNDYEYFLNPIINVLNHLGLNVTFKPKTHLYQNEYKISGNAQSVHKNRLIHHGTLLFDANLTKLNRFLKHQKKVIKSVASTPAKTKNIKDFLFIEATTESFIEYIINEVLLNDASNQPIELTKKDHFIINQLKKDKYESYDWNFGANATFTTTKKVNHKMVHFHIKKGRIDAITSKDDRLANTLYTIFKHQPLKYEALINLKSPLQQITSSPETLIHKLVFYP
jgi:lipoate-protein ligase A